MVKKYGGPLANTGVEILVIRTGGDGETGKMEGSSIEYR